MRDTNPCDEDTKDTGNGEQWRSTRDRLALIEEHLERRKEEYKVDP
jgi:hypothetical protein